MQPLSLYIHIPWCIKKCPYCDFNSHNAPQTIPESDYIAALVADLRQDLLQFPPRKLTSIFLGGGTPSLFSAAAFDDLFNQLQQLLPFSEQIEITMEANPGTVEQQRFKEYRQLGINRLSLGIQSFNAKHLHALGRIHDDKQAHKAIEAARIAGFNNLNLDLMHGLPNQSVAEGLNDLTTAIEYQPEHLSWYQLTIEPNTLFYKQKPPLPTEDQAFELEQAGFDLLAQHGYQRYEISAFAKRHCQSQHNMNYWLFGDYLGIGAGAHGKYTLNDKVVRTRKHKQPNEYMDNKKPFLAATETVSEQELLFEFMLNTTRLEQLIPWELFNQRTGLEVEQLTKKLKLAQSKGLVTLNDIGWQVTELGRRYTNNLQELFLP